MVTIYGKFSEIDRFSTHGGIIQLQSMGTVALTPRCVRHCHLRKTPPIKDKYKH